MGTESGSKTTKGTFTMLSSGFNSKPYSNTTTYTRDAVKETWSRSSSRTPGFHSPTRTGALRPLAFSFSYEKTIMDSGVYIESNSPTVRSTTSGYYYNQNTGTWGVCSFYAGSDNSAYSTMMTPDVVSRLDAQCRNDVLNKVKGSNVNLAVATAEAGKTMSMVGDAAIKIAGALSDLRRGDFIGAATSLGVAARKRAKSRFDKTWAKDRSKAIGSGWNSLNYGWRPLLDDVYGSAKDLAGTTAQGVVVTSRSKKTANTPYSFRKISKSKYGTETTTQTGTTRVGVTYSVTYMRSLGAAQDLPRLGITNPALVAWELVPYSFVVDWFLPIGNWLGTMDATLGTTFYSGFKTVFIKGQYSQLQTQESSRDYIYGGGRTCGFERVRVTRTILTDYPSPALPRPKNPLSFLHCTNALALLTNLIRK